MTILTKVEEFLANSEDEAYALIEEIREKNEVLSSSVKHKKETKKTIECWIVSIKIKLNELKELIELGDE